jgi:hypothetical protein
MIKRTLLVLPILGLVFAGTVFAPAPTEAQKKGKKGQSAKIQHGIVVKSEPIDLSENKAPKGALVGGSIGLVTGGSSGYNRRRNAAIGAAGGAILGAATSKKQMGLLYTVEVTGGVVQIVTDQTEIHEGDCVLIEETGQGANIRRVSDEVCSPAAAAVVADLEEEFQEEAEECASARKELAAASTDEELDRALTKMDILCSN